jgi:flavin reductase (DIM6/NTAB) family NADH-FMN oxidoreductase RutF
MDRPIDPRVFRRALGRFATGVIVLTAGPRAAPHAMSANAFMSGSLDPARVTHRYGCGDHTLVVGRVEELEIDGPSAPLLYYEGRYAGLQPAGETRRRSPEPYPSFF